MFNFKIIAAITVISVAGALSAQAATVPARPNGDAFVTDAANGGSDISFSWTSTPFSGQTASLDIAEQFNFSFVSYSDMGRERTGFYLQDSAGARYTNATTFCNSAIWGSFGGTCNVVNASTTPGVLFANLAAGSYSLGVFDNKDPKAGTVVFNVAAVPLPLGGLLLLSALGALGISRRRKAATA